jgi:hypothetical protein
MGPDFIRSGHRLVHCFTDQLPLRLKYERADDDLRPFSQSAALLFSKGVSKTDVYATVIQLNLADNQAFAGRTEA